MAREAIGQKLVVTWKINKGDLVRIRRRQSLDDNTKYFGIVVGEQKMDQVLLFPCINVYNMTTRQIELLTPEALEIVSRAFKFLGGYYVIRQIFFYTACVAIFINIILFGMANHTNDFGMSTLSIINIILLSMVFFSLAKK